MNKIKKLVALTVIMALFGSQVQSQEFVTPPLKVMLKHRFTVTTVRLYVVMILRPIVIVAEHPIFLLLSPLELSLLQQLSLLQPIAIIIIAAAVAVATAITAITIMVITEAVAVAYSSLVKGP